LWTTQSSRGAGASTARAAARGAASSRRTSCKASPVTTWRRRSNESRPPATRSFCMSTMALLVRCPMAPATFDEFKALYEQPAEMAPDLPTPMKGGKGPRFGASEAPVEHVAGIDDVPPPRPKAQRKATPIGPATPLPLDPEMVARVVAFAIEREAIRLRKEAGQPWPWTTDEI